jgi:hypothetical protein
VYQLVFHHYDQNTWHKQLKGGKIYFGSHSFRGFRPGHLTSRIWVGHHGGEELFTSEQIGSRETGKGQEQDTPQECTGSDLLPPARPHLLKFPEPPKIAPPGRDVGGISYWNHNAKWFYIFLNSPLKELMNFITWPQD